MKVSRRATNDRYYLFSLFGFAVFLHYLHHDEAEGVYHPWNGLSFIFGRYLEERFGEPHKIRSGFHWLPARVYHRITLYEPVWTLFFHFRRSNRWSVIDKSGKVLSTERTEGPKEYV